LNYSIQLQLTDECCKAIREAKRSKLPITMEHSERGTFIDVGTSAGPSKRFECTVQRLADQSVVDVVGLGKHGAEYRRIATLEEKFQVRGGSWEV